MPQTEPVRNPVVLMLDRRINPRVGENCLLQWWIRNTTGAVLGEVEVEVTEMGQGHQINSARSDIPLLRDQLRQLGTSFKANTAGTFELKVRLMLRPQDGTHEAWECLDRIQVDVDNPGARGKTNLIINDTSLVMGHIPEGDIHVNSGSLLEFAHSPPVEKPRFATLPQLPPQEELLHLNLHPVTPGLGSTINLSEFAEFSWKSRGRPSLERFEFIDDMERPVAAPVRAGAPFRLRLKSHRGGHITLISQGSSGRFFQFLPHAHYGQQVVQDNGTVLLADMIKNYTIRSDGQGPDPRKLAAPFTCSGRGLERALALVSPHPLRPEVDIFKGPFLPPPVLDASQVRDLLQRALELPDIELGYHAMEVHD